MKHVHGSTVTETGACRTIRASYDSMKQWRMDPNGYFLIRINPETEELEIGLCRKQNRIEVKITGNHPEEIYNTVVREGVTDDPSHLGYLGMELEKAYVAKKQGLAYVQDEEIV